MSGAPREIERVWLLRGRPPIPAGAERWEIEQGYLPIVPAPDEAFPEGRIRRVRRDDGSCRCFHTVKRGAGLVREEIEREIAEAEFLRLWPRTEGRRIRKTRHRIRDGGFVWELDEFHDLPLRMLEVELPSPEAEPEVPAALRPFLGREVTFDPRYRNFALAVEGLPERSAERGA